MRAAQLRGQSLVGLRQALQSSLVLAGAVLGYPERIEQVGVLGGQAAGFFSHRQSTPVSGLGGARLTHHLPTRIVQPARILAVAFRTGSSLGTQRWTEAGAGQGIEHIRL